MLYESSSNHGDAALDARPGLNRLSIDARSMFESLYPLIRSIAKQQLRDERPNHTLQPTALVNEAYLRLASSSQSWDDPRDFLAAVAVTIRRVLIDHARARHAAKRDPRGGLRGLWDVTPAPEADPADLIDLDQCLARLEASDPRRAEVAQLKLFVGLSNEEIASTLSIARSTVAADWSVARAWLSRALSEKPHADQPEPG